MTSKADFTKEWLNNTPEERREHLNALAANHAWLDEDSIREHDALATMVAEDEDATRQEPTT